MAVTKDRCPCQALLASVTSAWGSDKKKVSFVFKERFCGPKVTDPYVTETNPSNVT